MHRFRSPVHGLRAGELAKSYASFSLPSKEEGFEAITYAWQAEGACSSLLKSWILQKKLTQRAEEPKKKTPRLKLDKGDVGVRENNSVPEIRVVGTRLKSLGSPNTAITRNQTHTAGCTSGEDLQPGAAFKDSWPKWQKTIQENLGCAGGKQAFWEGWVATGCCEPLVGGSV